MGIDDYITKILDIHNDKNIYDDEEIYIGNYEGTKVFDFTRDSVIFITGDKNVKEYNDSFKNLYELCVNKSSKPNLSYETFKQLCEDLIVEKDFKKETIFSVIKNLKEVSHVDLKVIYGLKIKGKFLTIGKYSFISKTYIKEFINERYKDDYILRTETLLKVDELINERETYSYLLFEYKAIDKKLALKKNKVTEENIVNIIRYLYINEINTYIGLKQEEFHNRFDFAFHDEKLREMIYYGFKSFPIMINYPSTKTRNKIWQIFIKEEKSKFENNLLKAINWIGTSIDENNCELKIVEIAFAFETLLSNRDDGFNKNLTSGLAESYAIINGVNYQERIKLEKEFKEFYSIRSSVVHGDSKNNTYNIEIYTKMITNTIGKLLNNKKFQSIFNENKSISEVIKEIKYK